MLRKMAEILTFTTKPALKYQIQEHCQLSNRSCKEYITMLLKNGFLDVFPAIEKMPGPNSRHRVTFQTSHKGREFLKAYNRIIELLNSKET